MLIASKTFCHLSYSLYVMVKFDVITITSQILSSYFTRPAYLLICYIVYVCIQCIYTCALQATVFCMFMGNFNEGYEVVLFFILRGVFLYIYLFTFSLSMQDYKTKLLTYMLATHLYIHSI